MSRKNGTSAQISSKNRNFDTKIAFIIFKIKPIGSERYTSFLQISEINQNSNCIDIYNIRLSGLEINTTCEQFSGNQKEKIANEILTNNLHSQKL